MEDKLKAKLQAVKQAFKQTRRLYPEIAREYRLAGKAIEKQIKIAHLQESSNAK